jgi:hypothetical protein
MLRRSLGHFLTCPPGLGLLKGREEKANVSAAGSPAHPRTSALHFPPGPLYCLQSISMLGSKLWDR